MAGAFLMLILWKGRAHGRAYFMGDEHDISRKILFTYIKDEYFEKVQDFNFMQNKEGGTHRPISLSLRNAPNVNSTIPATDFGVSFSEK